MEQTWSLWSRQTITEWKPNSLITLSHGTLMIGENHQGTETLIRLLCDDGPSMRLVTSVAVRKSWLIYYIFCSYLHTNVLMRLPITWWSFVVILKIIKINSSSRRWCSSILRKWESTLLIYRLVFFFLDSFWCYHHVFMGFVWVDR